MPLLEKDPNLRDSGGSVGRKRSHDQFADAMAVSAVEGPSSRDSAVATGSSREEAAGSREPSPGPAKEAPAPSKRRPLTADQKAARAAELAAKKQERAQAAEARARERDHRRKKKEAEDEARAEKKRRKEAEVRRLEEDKARKMAAQRKLLDFFPRPADPKKRPPETGTSPAGLEAAPSTEGAAQRHAPSAYDRLFRPFFVRENTQWCRSRLLLDDETREKKCRHLDSFLAGGAPATTAAANGRLFRPGELLGAGKTALRRGCLRRPVRHIMETALAGPGPDSAGDALAQARRALAAVPVKTIAFQQDVRPPYHGTLSYKPFAAGRQLMRRLARGPTGRRFPLDYDYDSEAEWQEDEGEDLELEDEAEEEMDDDDDLDGFLDDADDAGLARRVLASSMEPESSGLCFDHGLGLCPPPAPLQELRMEFIQHDPTAFLDAIDPFATSYWSPTTAATDSRSEAAPAPSAPLGTACGDEGARRRLVPAHLLNDVKRAIVQNRRLSKLAIIDYIFHQFSDGLSRAEVKNTLEQVAEKRGPGRLKEWTLKQGHEIPL